MYISLAARICLALIFLNSGVKHLTGFQGFVSTIGGKTGLPFPGLIAVVSIICLIGGSLSLLLGYKTKIGAGLLIFFLIPTTLFFHPPVGEFADLTGFLKNLGLVGGLLMLVANGPGLMSVDGQT